MAPYLKPARRQELIEALAKLGLSRERGERITAFPENEADDNMFCHAQMCVNCIDDAGKGNDIAATFFALSAMCIVHIGQEADERGGMDDETFPKSNPYMSEFIAKTQAAKATQH